MHFKVIQGSTKVVFLLSDKKWETWRDEEKGIKGVKEVEDQNQITA